MRIARTTYPAGTWISRVWSNPVSLSVSVSLVYLLVFALGFAALFAPQRLVLRLSVSASGQQSVEWILPGGRLWESGVRSGDRIVSLDGVAPKAEHNGYWAGTSAVINTKEGPISVVAPTDGRIARRTWPLLALSPWFFLLGPQILLRATNRRTGRAAYALFTSTALELALAPSSERYIPLAVAAEFVMLPVFAYCFVRFFVLYPVERSSRLISYALLLPAALLALLGPAGLVWPELYYAGSLLRLLILFGYVSLATVLLTWSYITTRGSAVGSGLAVIGISTLASVLPFVLLYLLPEVLNRQPIVAPERAILALGILPVGFGYAIVRHKAMNVPLIQRWIVHGLLLAILLIAYASAAYALLRPPLRTVNITLFAIFAGLSFRWVYARLKRFVDGLVFKDVYEYRSSLQGLSRDLSLAGSYETLGASLPGRLKRMMNLEFCVLLVGDMNGETSDVDTGSASPLPPALVEAARRVTDDPVLANVFDGGRPVLIAPLHAHGTLEGHLCLGPKTSGEPFSSEDVAMLSTLSGHLASVLYNARLLEELRSKVELLADQNKALETLQEGLRRAQEEERTRIAADLHDEALQTALPLQRQIATDGYNRRATAKHLEVADALIRELRAVCASVRPEALDQLGLAAAIEVLALHLGEQAGESG